MISAVKNLWFGAKRWKTGDRSEGAGGTSCDSKKEFDPLRGRKYIDLNKWSRCQSAKKQVAPSGLWITLLYYLSPKSNLVLIQNAPPGLGYASITFFLNKLWGIHKFWNSVPKVPKARPVIGRKSSTRFGVGKTITIDAWFPRVSPAVIQRFDPLSGVIIWNTLWESKRSWKDRTSQ